MTGQAFAALGVELAGPRFRLLADGRVLTPETMTAEGGDRWRDGNVVVSVNEQPFADGSWSVVLRAEGVDLVEEVCLLDHRVDPAPGEFYEHRWWDFFKMPRSTAVFARYDDGGFFACYENPFGMTEASGDRLRLSYRPAQRYGGRFTSDALVLGRYRREGWTIRRDVMPGRDTALGEASGYTTLLGTLPGALDAGESRGLRQAVAARVPWRPAKCQVSHWDWGWNSYRLDLSGDNAEVMAIYERALDLCADIGVEVVLLSPTRHPDLAQHHDGPHQQIMFLGMGLEFHRDEWGPDATPEVIEHLLDMARRRGLGVIAYTNPQILWSRNDEWALEPDWDVLGQQAPGDPEEYTYRWTCLGHPAARARAIERYRDFRTAYDLAGVSFDFIYWVPCTRDDHGHLPGLDSQYAQWDGLRKVLATFPEDGWVETLIGTQATMPWGAAQFTHPHPALGDNQPQWMPAWPDLSIDRVNANYQRRVGYWLRNFGFTPSYKVPSVIGHQSNRRHAWPVERGWDWEGSRFNVLSALASAPSSIVVCFLPCWDEAEWKGMRDRDAAFIRQWIDFAKEHEQTLAGLEDLFDEPRPGAVDGTIARAADDGGFVFLANPDYDAHSIDVPVDHMLRELHPVPDRLWQGTVTVDPHEVAVLEILPETPQGPLLVGVAGRLDAAGGVQRATGVPGTSAVATVVGSDGHRRQIRVRFADDGVQPTPGPWSTGSGPCNLHQLEGDVEIRASWTPGTALPGLLASLAPPVAPDGDETRQPWSEPSRLRLFFELLDPGAVTIRCRVDGADVEVQQAYVGTFPDVIDERIMAPGHNLMGHYVDLDDKLHASTDLQQPWEIELSVKGLRTEQFRAVRVAHLPVRTTEIFNVEETEGSG